MGRLCFKVGRFIYQCLRVLPNNHGVHFEEVDYHLPPVPIVLLGTEYHEDPAGGVE